MIAQQVRQQSARKNRLGQTPDQLGLDLQTLDGFSRGRVAEHASARRDRHPFGLDHLKNSP